jgi:hypothetical protein
MAEAEAQERERGVQAWLLHTISADVSGGAIAAMRQSGQKIAIRSRITGTIFALARSYVPSHRPAHPAAEWASQCFFTARSRSVPAGASTGRSEPISCKGKAARRPPSCQCYRSQLSR